jgi:hypothetical protein
LFARAIPVAQFAVGDRHFEIAEKEKHEATASQIMDLAQALIARRHTRNSRR